MPVFECSRKVQVFGSSLALTLPAMFAKVTEIERGSIVNIIYGLEGVMVVSRLDNSEALIECLNSILDNLKKKRSKLIDDRVKIDV